MNAMMIKQLVLKDWYFNRAMVILSIALGAVSLFLVALGSDATFYIGSIMFMTVVIGTGAGIVILSVTYERKDQTLPFVMSLPISAAEYTAAKILANVLIFLVPWTTLLIGSLLVLPDGLTPFVVILITEIFVAFCFLLGVALVSESEVWTIGIMIALNLCFNFFLYSVSHLPGIAEYMNGPTAVWNTPVFGILAAEFAVLVLIITLTFYLQGRKKDYL